MPALARASTEQMPRRRAQQTFHAGADEETRDSQISPVSVRRGGGRVGKDEAGEIEKGEEAEEVGMDVDGFVVKLESGSENGAPAIDPDEAVAGEDVLIVLPVLRQLFVA